MAIILQLDIASMKLISAMTNAAGNSAMIAFHSNAGTPTLGSPAGMLADDAPAVYRESEEVTAPGDYRDRDQHAGQPGANRLRPTSRMRRQAEDEGHDMQRIDPRTTIQVSTRK